MTPPFIVLDGPDGSGTTKHTDLLFERFQKQGIASYKTAEPSSGPIGSHIRTFLQNGHLPPDALQLLFTADRADHLQREILPALERGEVVICDRYVPSTLAYGKALGLPYQWLKDMNNNFIHPTCLLFALPSFEVCQERLSRRAEKDTMEGSDLQRSVYDCYKQIAAEDPRIQVIDTGGDKAAVHEAIWNIVSSLPGL